MNQKNFKAIWRSASAILLTLMLIVPNGGAFVHAAPGDTTRVSVGSGGGQANGYSHRPDISGNGRYVVFESVASNLVADDTNGFSDVFVHDRATGGTVRVSVATDGTQANGGSGEASISGDGRFVAFESDATNLVSGDANGAVDIFVHDRQTGETTRVSVDSNGLEANDPSGYPAISADGRYVAFISDASNLVDGDTNGVGDVFVHDRLTGATTRVSVDSGGAQANSGSMISPSISADGRYIAFSSRATNLVGGDANNSPDVFVHDRLTGATTRVSVRTGGVEADRGGYDAFISGNGRFVSFISESQNLVDTEVYHFSQVYIHDRETGVTNIVSVYLDGSPLVGNSDWASVSADGRYVAYQFDDRGDGQAVFDIYIHDRSTGMLASVPHPRSDTHSLYVPVISADGKFVAFMSPGALTAGDTNGVFDIFLHEVAFVSDLNPSVASVEPLCGVGCTYPTGDVVSFKVTFSEIVTGVTVDDFALEMSGGISAASVAGVSGAGAEYVVTVNSGTGDGSLRLDIIDNDSIQDGSGNPLGGAGAGNGNFNTGQWYIVHKSIPVVLSILHADPSPATGDAVHFTVNFSTEVSGVDADDFSITADGITGASVIEVSGSGSAYTVKVATGAGDGTLRLDLIDNDTILDSAGLPLGGMGAGNGNFTAGEPYAIDRNVPVVVSILRMDPNPTAAAVVHFSVTFSEPVNGVDGGDFLLTTSGVSGAVMTEILYSGSTYYVTVHTGTGNGTIRLDVLDNDSIVDAVGNPLGGAGAGNGGFSTGETYTINKITYVTVTERIRSNGKNDGWVLESSEDSNVGGSMNSTDTTFRLGDDAQNRQYRAVLHFPTQYLPDNAVVTKVILMIKAYGVVGTNPFTTHGNISIDMRHGAFGSLGPFAYKALQLMDFQAPAHAYSVGVIQDNPVNGWYWTMLDSSAFPYINKTGTTQLRFAFQLDDNNDFGNDFLLFYSGSIDDQRDRPRLLIEYYVPR